MSFTNNWNKVMLAIRIKCNSDLAEDLLNLKKNEIANLEKIYESKIEFSFNAQYSLHDPIIEIENLSEEKNEIEVKNNKRNKDDYKKTRKKSSSKKTNVKAKKVKKNEIKNSDTEKRIEDDNRKSSKVSDEDVEEKTGWWS